ncbi:hypothetical protein SAMN05216378_2730 [Paenibacillus catalpae]|uniref:Colicin import membrane protein n=1 Tax=Paenibacillus catalpae TaxID=1045775 RepID=A0A1I1YNC5_9BACL|nr:hypothetical protein [Paenibacillus catalpae]SFE21094.1 hypothetical protein SAMN05216378_2730 [Paenibacillus catalpae]
MKFRMPIAVLLLAVLLSAILPAAVTEAAVNMLSSTAQKQFDKTKAGMTSTDAAKLQASYQSFVQQQNSIAAQDTRIKSASKANDDKESELRQKIRTIDKAKLEALERKVAQLKNAYQPLFNQYAAAQAELKAARKYGIKELTAAVQLKVDLFEISVKSAKEEIRAAQAALTSAKAAANDKMKRLRGQLDAITEEEKRISVEKSAISQLNKQKSEEWSDLLYALRSYDGKTSIRSLATLNGIAKQIADRQVKIEGCEKKIAEVNKTVSNQLS